MAVALFLYSYPPIGGPGTPRHVRLVSALQELGGCPVVVTADPVEMTATPGFRLDVSRDRPALVETVPLSSRSAVRGWLNRHRRAMAIAWFAAYPHFLDYAAGWSAKVKKLEAWLETRPDIGVLYVSAPPYSAIPAVARLARRTGRKLVVDLRDLWTCDPLGYFPSKVHYRWIHRVERRILNSAACVVVNTAEAADSLARAYGSVCPQVVVIDNSTGGQTEHRTSIASDDATLLRLVYTGTLSEDQVEFSRFGRYRPFPLDLGSRSLRDLLVALQTTPILQQLAQMGRTLKVVIVGSVPAAEKDRVEEAGLAKYFEFCGSVTQAETATTQATADALLVLQFSWVDSRRPMPYTPGKTFEYLETGLPILAPVGLGSLRDLLADYPQSYLADPRDPAAISAALLDIARACAGYDREAFLGSASIPATDRLARLLSEIDGRGAHQSPR